VFTEFNLKDRREESWRANRTVALCMTAQCAESARGPL
jgi:hypothetical protein